IFRSVDLPEPLRPIRQTRSPDDTDNSTPDNSGVPPKVSRISFNWIGGGAIDQSWFGAGCWARWRWMRRMAWSSADKNAERSRGEYDFGPPVTSPDERRSVIRLRTASVMPMDCSVNGLPFGAIT